MANAPRYTPEEQEAFIEVAKIEGISGAMKELGYPNSWATGNRWFEARGIEAPVVNEIKARANEMKEALNDRNKIVVAEVGLERVLDILNDPNLSADDLKKASEAYQKFVNSMNLIEGKSTDIVENRSEVPSEIMAAIEDYESKSATITDLFV